MTVSIATRFYSFLASAILVALVTAPVVTQAARIVA